MSKNLKPAFLIGLVMLIASCAQDKQKGEVVETYGSGHIKVLADESFEPIVAEEEYVFEGINQDAKLDISYLTENALLNSFLNDSVRIAILSRELTAAETKILNDRKLPPVTQRVAVDAIAIIVNKTSADTLITVDEVKKMLKGQTKTDKNIVFDNPNSSIVRYLKEFAGGVSLQQKNIYALKTNKEVIKYVSEHTNAIGIIGFSWLNDPDKDYAPYVDAVQLVGVKDAGSKEYNDEYFKPSQTTIVLQQYPLSRGLYVINCTSKAGLGTGFASFLTSERGQRIILRSGLLPDSIPRREISIRKDIKTE
jgi:phosphate transport system substrate-binding protein